MKLLFDLFPVILFFGAFKYAEKNPETAAAWVASLLGSAVVDVKQAPILLATVVVIAATIAQIAWVHFRHGKVDKMLWISLGLVVVFGGMTLAFQNEAFIKWKPTILYWVFAISLGFSALVMKKNPMKAMLGEQLTLPEPVWGKVTLSWIAFFAVMGVLNLLVAFNFPTDTWVNFKLFGGMGLMLVFVLGQGLLLSKYIEEK
ncbi:septation protein A [Dechloromonas agitata]|uniref:Inner membrane-spanning protein YciB n=1 Tax=Dechloromonas agitata TaxID=73030 RepID=A0A930BRY2_9RHOO|nr:septation protein A [Dechloromonas agitata]MBF1164499.1 septation protein A [Dechloromonas agitata]MDE1545309.1 septation protein A [Dechloromonas agitata]